MTFSHQLGSNDKAVQKHMKILLSIDYIKNGSILQIKLDRKYMI